MGWQSGDVGTCTCLNKHRLDGTACSLAQVLELLLLVLVLVILGRSLLLPVTAARTHASCSVSCKLHFT